MLSRLILILPLICSGVAMAAEVIDATGRSVQVPDHIMHVVPAGQPAAILLESIAPDLMIGWPGPLSDGHAVVAPASVFGWLEEPPSINRVLGLTWLEGHEPASVAAAFYAIVYGRVLTTKKLGAVLGGVHTLQP